MKSSLISLLAVLMSLPLNLVLFSPVKAQTYIIGVEDNQYLPHYAYINGQYTGFGREVLDAFFTTMGYEYHYKALPVRRLFESLIVTQNVDFKYPDNPLWSTDLKQGAPVVYSDPVVASTDGVSLLPQNKGRGIDSINMLATVRGFSAPQWAPYIEAGKVRLSENPSLTRLLEQTLIGRVDGAYANVDVVNYLLEYELYQPSALEFDDSLPHSKTHYYLSSIKYPEIIAEFNQWIRENTELVYSLKKKFNLDLRDE